MDILNDMVKDLGFKDKDEFLSWNCGDNLLCIHNKKDEYIYYAIDDVVIGYYKTDKRIE